MDERQRMGLPGCPDIDCFAETLAHAASTRADLTAICDSLGDSLATLLDEPPAEPAWESP